MSKIVLHTFTSNDALKRFYSIEEQNRYKCLLCANNKVISQVLNKGYSNLLSHLNVNHEGWKNDLQGKT